MELILVRHGETDSNQTHALDTAIPGAPLNVNGLLQAQRLVQKWRDLELPKPDAIMASSLHRTAQTIIPLAASYQLGFRRSAKLNEISAGDLEMRTDTSSIGQYLQIIGQWMQGDLAAQMPGGENGWQVARRFDQVVAEIHGKVGDRGVAVLTAHGALIRFWSCLRTPNLPFALAGTQPMVNTGTTWLSGRPGEFSAKTWCDRPVDHWRYDPNITEINPSKIEPQPAD